MMSASLWRWAWLALAALSTALPGDGLQAETERRCLVVEWYFDSASSAEAELGKSVQALADQRGALQFRLLDVQVPKHADRFRQICRHFRIEEKTPLLYACGRAVAGADSADEWQEKLDALCTMTVYVRTGCPRCSVAKEYLRTKLAPKFPGLTVDLRDIAVDRKAAQELEEMLARKRVGAVSVPVFDVCGEVVIGFSDAARSGDRLEAILRKWSTPCPQRAEKRAATDAIPRQLASFGPASCSLLTIVQTADDRGDASAEMTPLPLPEESAGDDLPPNQPVQDEIQIPLLGAVRASNIGLPLFTVVVGLVDGFNPCAMWVLLFLLSVLVNLHSRWKILAVAGTFVAISGAAYFAFMAAWFSVFQLIGLTRVVQVMLGCLALLIGAVHVKDFFALHHGVTLSIPESAKPRIYERVRRIVTAENLTGAVIGAAVLAVLVNIVELLCTAGLPAIYTQVLASQQLTPWANYGYLLLYDAAYMLDDALMVGLVVLTLGRHKLQEREGRWLKLVSGAAVILLGLVILVRPAWLGM